MTEREREFSFPSQCYFITRVFNTASSLAPNFSQNVVVHIIKSKSMDDNYEVDKKNLIMMELILMMWEEIKLTKS